MDEHQKFRTSQSIELDDFVSAPEQVHFPSRLELVYTVDLCATPHTPPKFVYTSDITFDHHKAAGRVSRAPVSRDRRQRYTATQTSTVGGAVQPPSGPAADTGHQKLGHRSTRCSSGKAPACSGPSRWGAVVR
jgi:hypothetical protein